MIGFPGLSINSDERATISVIEEIAGGRMPYLPCQRN